MTFLNPLLLLGLLGMAVPVLIHLLSRRTARHVEFSSLDFLRKLERKSMRRVRFRQLLLLIVRMAIVAAIAVAMARPTLVGVAAGGGRGSTSAVLVLDGSYSMGAAVDGTTLFEAAKDRAHEILRTLDDGDEVLLFVPGGAGESRTEGLRDLGLVRERVDGARAGWGAVQNRLESTIRNISMTAENLSAANSRIRDVDVAYETSRMTSNQILQQAGISMLSQANLVPGLALSLLVS